MHEDYTVSKAARGFAEIEKMKFPVKRTHVGRGPSTIERRGSFDAVPGASRTPEQKMAGRVQRQARADAAAASAAQAEHAASLRSIGRNGKTKVRVENPQSFSAPKGKPASTSLAFMTNPTVQRVNRGALYAQAHPWQVGGGAAAITAGGAGGLYALNRRD